MFVGKKSAQIREILISESTWEEMTCLFTPSLTLFSGRHFDLTGDERIHFTLYWNQQIDTGLRYMEGDGEVVACFRIIAFQSASCYPLTLLPGKRFGCWEGKGKACRSYILVARALSAGVRFVPEADVANASECKSMGAALTTKHTGTGKLLMP